MVILFCLCTGRITIFTFVKPTNSNENVDIRLERDNVINEVEIELQEIPINPPDVFIIQHPNNQIGIGIKQ